ncbi:unnamed protein product, partial [Polarella glacialis]
ISSCEKAGLWEQAVGLLRRLPTLRLLPDAVSLNAAISACEKSGQLLDGVKWQRALDLLSVMACGPQPLCQPDVVSFSSTMSAFEKASQWQMALGLLSQMPDRALRPDRILFNACVSACEKGLQWRQ